MVDRLRHAFTAQIIIADEVRQPNYESARTH